ncbi:MAG: YIP1 family protein [Verrucomicrobia bacterium]|nr:YIP1 family protein [Verrucomicrobiota bacterium]
MQSTPANALPPLPNPRTSTESIPLNPSFWGLLDRLLRRRDDFFEEIFAARRIGERIRWYLVAIVLLSGFYGLTMGGVGITEDTQRALLQMVTSAVKVPLLYVCSVAICFPVLYIVLVLMGARLSFMQTLSLILLALTLNSVLLASCAPILIFFMVTGSDYHFIKLLHVAAFAFSGAWAMLALWQGLRTMCEKSDLYPRQAIKILQVWMLIFGFVGTQMAWSLRPFVGSPELGYELLRSGRQGNFYQAVWSSMVNLARNLED